MNRNENDELIRCWQEVNRALSALIAIVGRIPLLGKRVTPVLAGARLIGEQQLRQLQVQRAANDRAFKLAREAAANEAQFRQTGTGF